jgi:hypothetical protein
MQDRKTEIRKLEPPQKGQAIEGKKRRQRTEHLSMGEGAESDSRAARRDHHSHAGTINPVAVPPLPATNGATSGPPTMR